jgi:uncharacterized protein
MQTFNLFRTLHIGLLFFGMLFMAGQRSNAGIQAASLKPRQAASDSSPDVKERIRRYFFDAARSGNLHMLREFVAATYDLDTADEKGYTALILAAYHGQEAAVDLLLGAGANACAEDHHGNTALMGAIFKGEFTIARKLLNAKCAPDHRNAAGQTAAMYAALFGRLEILDVLKAQGADLTATDSAGNSAEKLALGEFAQPTSASDR